jgi:hypothetical protein
VVDVPNLRLRLFPRCLKQLTGVKDYRANEPRGPALPESKLKFVSNIPTMGDRTDEVLTGASTPNGRSRVNSGDHSQGNPKMFWIPTDPNQFQKVRQSGLTYSILVVAMTKRKPGTFSATKAVKANARERVGQPKAARVVEDTPRTGRRAKHKPKLEQVILQEE